MNGAWSRKQAYLFAVGPIRDLGVEDRRPPLSRSLSLGISLATRPGRAFVAACRCRLPPPRCAGGPAGMRRQVGTGERGRPWPTLARSAAVRRRARPAPLEPRPVCCCCQVHHVRTACCWQWRPSIIPGIDPPWFNGSSATTATGTNRSHIYAFRAPGNAPARRPPCPLLTCILTACSCMTSSPPYKSWCHCPLPTGGKNSVAAVTACAATCHTTDGRGPSLILDFSTLEIWNIYMK